MSHSLYINRIPEQVVPGKRLGRHVAIDSRSLAYRVPRSGATPVDQLWTRHIAILDQGDLGSCTGNALTGALGTSPIFDSLPTGFPTLNEAEAVKLYGLATQLDSYPGTYPPDDTGSDGTSVCKAGKQDGFISGYLAAATIDDMVAALQTGPVIVGVNWYTSFDDPASNGLISISSDATVRGGHEFVIRGVDVTGQLFKADNSWAADWGDQGSMQFSYDTMDQLLSEEGDCTVPLALSVPAPTPNPPTPTPTPVAPDQYSIAFAGDPRVQKWAAHERHVGDNKYAASAFVTWAQAEGLM
jgi:hypothetical protein